ncbi:ribosomal RNA processing protein 1 homolog [Danaus plexippus]|uniref:ribosomal RNA processing protein 1 homolog n=1 Tax=Danaus plexippus TaxID=13037 RepID=UPI002AB23940|nr:ribosomal RNA processing protein 1 homolog [Danaus plexippus]
MKRLEKKKVKNPKHKKKSIIKPKKEKVLVVAQEFKFARLLSGNEKKTRDRVLKTLKKWLLNCFEKGYEFKEDDFIRVWKGLFYAVWMSDKPLVQEELCDNIAEILDLFPVEQIHHAILMMKAGFRVLATEWYGLDQHRMDKFLMLVRRYLRGGWRCLRRADWSLDSCHRFVDMLTGQDGLFAVKTPSFARNSLSLMLHVIDCYLEELSKVSEGSIPLASMACLLQPFTLHVRCDTPLSVPARRLLTQLITQTDLGLEYEQKARAWKKMGCPPGGPDALELVEDEDDEEHEDDEQEEVLEDGPGPLDPRAGRVSVLLTPLPVPGAELADQLRGAATSHRAKRRAEICAERFLALSSSEYPLKVPEADIPEEVPKGVSPGKAAKSLVRLERSLGATKDELALKAMSKKHRKKLLAKARAGLSIVEEVTAGSRDGEWQVEEAEDTEHTKDEDKENLKKKKNRKRKMKNDQEDGNKKRRVTGDDVIETNESNHKNSITEIKKKKRDKAKIKTKKNNERKVSGGDGSKAVISIKPINKENNTKTQKDRIENKERAESVASDERKNEKMSKDKEKKQEKKRNEKDSERVTPSKVKNYQKATQAKKDSPKKVVTFDTPKKVKFVLKKNSMQLPGEYYRSVQRSPDIPYDGTRQPAKTNLKPSTPSPINPFFKKYKLKIK